MALSDKSEISDCSVQPKSPVLHHILRFSFSSSSLNGVLKIWSYVNVIKEFLYTWIFATMKQQLVECCDFSTMSRLKS